MKVLDTLRQLIQRSPNWSQNKIASKLGMSNAAMSNRMRRNDQKVDFVVDVLDILGYDLVIVPKESNLPRGSYVVTNEDSEK